MSLRRMTLILVAAAFATCTAAIPAAAAERRDQVRDRMAETIVRLLPPQPKPARRFAPVPARPQSPPVAVWIDRELVWVGQPDGLQDLIATFPRDAIDPVPVLPPFPIDLDEREICVGTVLDGDFDGDGPIVLEMDCELVPVR